MDMLKEAFSKIKEEINFLKKELDLLKNELNAIRSYQNLNSNKIDSIEKKAIPTHYLLGEYNKSNKPAIDLNENLLLNGLKAQNFIFSTGNEGVPTNKPTDKPTDNIGINFNNSNENSGFLNISSNFEKAHIIISSLDDVKKDIRKTFKNLTSQEMLVFSTIYTYEDQKYENINYKLISDKSECVFTPRT